MPTTATNTNSIVSNTQTTPQTNNMPSMTTIVLPPITSAPKMPFSTPHVKKTNLRTKSSNQYLFT